MAQNATWPATSYSVRGFTSDMPNNCDVVEYKIEKVLDETGKQMSNSYWQERYSLANNGTFHVKNSSEKVNHMQFHISAKTTTKKTPTNLHALNVSVTTNIWTNPNIPPLFDQVEGYTLDPILLWVGDNYSQTPYVLPQTVDPDGN